MVISSSLSLMKVDGGVLGGSPPPRVRRMLANDLRVAKVWMGYEVMTTMATPKRPSVVKALTG